MQLHGFSVGIWQGKSGTLSKGWANGPKQVGVGIALIGGLPGPCSTSCPLSHNAILLADASFVLKPYLYWRIGRHIFQVGFQGIAEVFL